MMYPRFEFRLDGTLYENPQGWDGITLELRRPETVKALLREVGAELIFTGAAYEYLLAQKRNDSCQSVEVEIKFDCAQKGDIQVITLGVILLIQVEFNLTKCSAKCQVVDNNVSSRIYNNASLKVIPRSNKTKNGLDIAVAPIYTIDMHDTCSGASSGIESHAMRVFDCLTHIIGFVSDNTVGFRSSLFDIGGEWEGLFLTTGLYLQQNSEARMEYQWDVFISELDKKCNLGFYIDESSGQPVLVLEKYTDLFTAATSLTLNLVYELSEKSDQQKNFSSVKFGSGATIDSQGCSAGEPAFPDQIDFVGCKDEEFIVLGNCNINRALDLKGSWIVSSNVIEECVFSGSTDYDEDVIFLHCDNVDSTLFTAISIASDVFASGFVQFYNAALYNDQVSERYIGGIPNTIVQYFGSNSTPTSSTFKAVYNLASALDNNGTAIAVNSPTRFNDDYTAPYNDPSNNYGNGTAQGVVVTKANSRFTAPLNSSYKFRFYAEEYYVPLSMSPIIIYFSVYDAANVLKYSHPEAFPMVTMPSSGEVITPYIPMNATDYCIVEIQGSPYLNFSKIFEFELLSPLSSTVEEYQHDAESYLNNIIKITAPISYADWKTLEQNPTSKVNANDGKTNVSGHIQSAVYTLSTGIVDLTLVTTNS